MTADAWVAIILAAVGLAAVYFLPKVQGSKLKVRSMRRCAQDAEIAQVRHGRPQ